MVISYRFEFKELGIVLEREKIPTRYFQQLKRLERNLNASDLGEFSNRNLLNNMKRRKL